MSRSDGVLDIAAHDVTKATDGALIEVQSDGMRHGPAEVMARLARGEVVGRDEYFFRTVMRFQTDAPQWAHLNKVLALACGSARPRAWCSTFTASPERAPACAPGTRMG